MVRNTHRVARIAALICLLAACAAGHASAPAAHAQAAMRPLTITSVAVDNSSVKIDVVPVPGARDYRVFDTSDPMLVKYAGMVHLTVMPSWCSCHFAMSIDNRTPVMPLRVNYDANGVTQPKALDVPSPEIEWNRLLDDKPHRLVVQAVDALGPVPPANLYTLERNALMPPSLPMPMDMAMGMSMARISGSNDGPTPDGYISINGQGPSTDQPRVIAQSAPFFVQADPKMAPLPSTRGATQTFLDTFNDSEAPTLQQLPLVDNPGTQVFTLNPNTPKAWSIEFESAMTLTHFIRPMIDSGHFMDVIPSAGTESLMTMSPLRTADFSGGRLLHVTMEVDMHENGRRWVGFDLAPAADPFVKFWGAFNRTDTGVITQLLPNQFTTSVLMGPQSLSKPDSSPRQDQIIGMGGDGDNSGSRHYLHWSGNGIALDNRSRFDLFVTTRHAALFEDGQFVSQADMPSGGLPFSSARIYFYHQMYGSTDELHDLIRDAPWEVNTIHNFPHTDERHWDNMGFEVLPTRDVPSDWHALAAFIHMPARVAPDTVTAPRATSM